MWNLLYYTIIFFSVVWQLIFFNNVVFGSPGKKNRTQFGISLCSFKLALAIFQSDPNLMEMYLTHFEILRYMKCCRHEGVILSVIMFSRSKNIIVHWFNYLIHIWKQFLIPPVLKISYCLIIIVSIVFSSHKFNSFQIIKTCSVMTRRWIFSLKNHSFLINQSRFSHSWKGTFALTSLTGPI